MQYNIKVKIADSGGKQTTFPTIFSLIGRAFFDRKNERS